MTAIKHQLQAFQEKLNANQQIGKLINNWNPNIIIKALNSDEQYTMFVADGKISHIENGLFESAHEITIEGDSDILLKVFSGTTNPAEAVLDGELFVYGGDQDQIKLDALTLVIWGM